jgi:hypothetical protein
MYVHRAARRRALEHRIMDNHPGTVTVWQSGRLAPRAASRPFEFTGEHWLVAALLLLSALVLTMFVAVLEKDVGRNEMAHVAQRERAIAEAQCEAGQPADQRGRCIALFNGDEVATSAQPEATPDNTVSGQANDAHAMTVSLVSSDR